MLKTFLVSIFDVLFFPFTLLAAIVLLVVRRIGVHTLRNCKAALLIVGVFPIRRHYYEPLFDTEAMRAILPLERDLPGIDFNTDEQLALLSQFKFQNELLSLPRKAATKSHTPPMFYYHNGFFGPGDAELSYCMIRHFKPRRIIEIGSGYSTLIARHALKMNADNAGPACKHICIEPFEKPWLEKCGATIIRQCVETIDHNVFLELDENDILFIDSSHVIRPGGDVLCEYLRILPRLRAGVLVHVHDIFTPRDYHPLWVCDEVRFWNEQYLLEAFLCHNHSFKIVCALNFLKNNYPNEISAIFPVLGTEMWRQPGSFWIQRV